MQQELSAAHVAILAHIDELELLLRQAKVERAALADVRWRLSRASNRRLTLLETRIFPHLLSVVSAAETSPIRQLQASTNPLLTQTVTHVGTWTVERVMSDLAGYRRASLAMRITMRARVTAERDALYPLLTRYGGSTVDTDTQLARFVRH